MSIETLGAYSPNTVYGQLTMPFFEKPVAINSHTPYDEDDEAVVLTRNSFYNNNSKMLVSIEDIREMKGLELDDRIANKVIPDVHEALSENELPSFQLSKFTNGSGVVFNALQNGYPADKAVLSGQAFMAYNAILKQDFTTTIQQLSNVNYKVIY